MLATDDTLRPPGETPLPSRQCRRLRPTLQPSTSIQPTNCTTAASPIKSCPGHTTRTSPLQHPPQPHRRPPNHPMLANGDWQRSRRRRLRLRRSWRRRGRGWKPLRLIARDSGRSKSHCSDCILEWYFAIVFNSLLKGSRYAFTRICNLKKLTECFINSHEVLPFVWLSLRGMSPCFSLQIERGRSVTVWNI